MLELKKISGPPKKIFRIGPFSQVEIQAFVPEPYWRLVATFPAGQAEHDLDIQNLKKCVINSPATPKLAAAAESAGEAVLQAHGQMGKIWDEREAIEKIETTFRCFSKLMDLKIGLAVSP